MTSNPNYRFMSGTRKLGAEVMNRPHRVVLEG